MARSPILPIAIILVVVLLFTYSTGLLEQFLQPTPGGQPDQTFDITISNFNDPVASSARTSSDGRTVTVEATNLVLSNGGGTYTATFSIHVRDTKQDQQTASFTMKVAVGEYNSPAGTSWPVLVRDSSGQCYDIEYSVTVGGTGAVLPGCEEFYGSINIDGGSLAINIAIEVNGDLFGTGLPPTGFGIPLTFSIIGATDASLVWKATG